MRFSIRYHLAASMILLGAVSAIDWGRICTDVNLRGNCVTYQSDDNQCGQSSSISLRKIQILTFIRIQSACRKPLLISTMLSAPSASTRILSALSSCEFRWGKFGWNILTSDSGQSCTDGSNTFQPGTHNTVRIFEQWNCTRLKVGNETNREQVPNNDKYSAFLCNQF